MMMMMMMMMMVMVAILIIGFTSTVLRPSISSLLQSATEHRRPASWDMRPTTEPFAGF